MRSNHVCTVATTVSLMPSECRLVKQLLLYMHVLHWLTTDYTGFCLCCLKRDTLGYGSCGVTLVWLFPSG